MENTYKTTDSGALGKTAEKALKEALDLMIKVAAVGRTDIRKRNVQYESKTGAGELGNVGGKLVKGSSMVIYVPVVAVEADGSVSAWNQTGWVLPRADFLDILDSCGLIRKKTATDGTRKITIQTFWNRSKNAPHGRGLAKMTAAFEEAVAEGQAVELIDWLLEMTAE